MTSPAQLVREFHAAYGVTTRTIPTAVIPEADLRRDLLREETEEYDLAEQQGDLVEIADGLADVVYIAYGTALAHGIDLDAVLREVHRSNMSKLGEDGQPILREDGKVMKGPHYSPPDIAAALEGHRPNGCCDYHRHVADGCCHCEPGCSCPTEQPTPSMAERGFKPWVNHEADCTSRLATTYREDA